MSVSPSVESGRVIVPRPYLRKKVPTDCPVCGASFLVLPHRLRDGRRPCCSIPCGRAHRPTRAAAFAHGRAKRVDEALFWSRVSIPRDVLTGCWMWTGDVSDRGYGLYRGGAHRVAFALVNGPIPRGSHCLHRCEHLRPRGDASHRLCVNPAHLYLGSPADNSADMRRSGRIESGERRYNARLTDAMVLELLRRRARGETLHALAREFGVSPSTVFAATKGPNWKHLNRQDVTP
jgi:hypothetical protein